jgi:hypothetical protein
MPANLLEQVRCSRFRHESADWEHVGHRWRGAFAPIDFQLPLWPSTISFARAMDETVSGVPCWTQTDTGGGSSTDVGTGRDAWNEWDGCSPIAASMIQVEKTNDGGGGGGWWP